MRYYILVSTIFIAVAATLKVCSCLELDDHVVEISWSGSNVYTEYSRIKRQAPSTGGNKNSLIQSDRVQFLSAHNNLRRRVTSATDMLKMVWNGALESMAQQWANGCNFKHGQPTPNSSPFNPIGQNLFATTAGAYNVSQAVESWYTEVQYYTYDTMTCVPQQQCGHYTQVVWSKSYAVGCGIARCPTLGSTQMSNAYYTVCNYGPAGNYVGTKPYKVGGAPCSACPSDKTTCDAGLCCASNQCSVVTECNPTDLSTCLCDASYYDSLSAKSGKTSSRAVPVFIIISMGTVVMAITKLTT